MTIVGGPTNTTVLRGAALAGQSGRVDLSLRAGRIASITRSRGRNGGFVLPLMSDAHVHLDKTFVAHRLPRQAAPDLVEGVAADFILFEADGIDDAVSRPLCRRQVWRSGTLLTPIPGGGEAWP